MITRCQTSQLTIRSPHFTLFVHKQTNLIAMAIFVHTHSPIILLLPLIYPHQINHLVLFMMVLQWWFLQQILQLYSTFMTYFMNNSN